MSFFLNLFTKKQTIPKVIEDLTSQLLRRITQPPGKFTFQQTKNLVLEFISSSQENLALLFSRLEQPSPLPPPESLIYLALVFHILLKNDDYSIALAVQLRDSPIYWFTKAISQDSFYNERLFTEPSTSSFIPLAQQPLSTTPKEVSKNERKQQPSSKQKQVDEKRLERYQQTKSQTQYDVKVINNSLSILRLAQLYYTYVQKIAVNLDLYEAIQFTNFPYSEPGEVLNTKFILLWLYKVQNIVVLSIRLLEAGIQREVSQVIWEDFLIMQSFLVQEVQKLIEQYSTIPASDSLSLFELFQDVMQQASEMQKFADKNQIENNEIASFSTKDSIVQEFLTFAAKLKVLNSNQFKKSLKVPNKLHPYPESTEIQQSLIKRSNSSEQIKRKPKSDTKKSAHRRGQSVFSDDQ